MATQTLAINGDAGGRSTDTECSKAEGGSGTDSDGEYWDECEETIASSDDDTTYCIGTGLSTSVESYSFTVEDMPADFSSMNTVRFQARLKKNVTDDDNVFYYGWVCYRSDTEGVLASNSSVDRDSLTTSWATYDYTDLTAASGSKAIWDLAVIQLRVRGAAVGMPDANREVWCTATEITIDYNTTGGGTAVKDIICSGIIPFPR